MNEHPLRFLHAARLALENYDVGEVDIDEKKEVGHIGFSGYHMVKFRADGGIWQFPHHRVLCRRGPGHP